MAWLDDERYRWIREHLLQRPDDEVCYTAMAAGRAEDAPPRPWYEGVRESGAQPREEQATYE